jgi:GntR family transcriptional regulator, transcriptional repressor for pyruvate dehydrogenase complex
VIPTASPSSRSVLDTARARLRSVLLKSEAGAHLGSEADMAQEIGVSLPTFRQVARVLEQEQLLEIKRGKQGGLYVRRPSLDIVVETASLFLYFEESTVRDLIVTSSILSAEAARSSASAPLDMRKEVFGEILEKSQSTDCQPIDDFKRDEWLMMECLARTCSNKAVSLFLHTTQHVSMMRYAEWSVIDEHKMAAHKALRSRVIDAILIGDGEVACLLRRRQLPLVLESIPEAKLNSKIVTR